MQQAAQDYRSSGARETRVTKEGVAEKKTKKGPAAKAQAPTHSLGRVRPKSRKKGKWTHETKY